MENFLSLRNIAEAGYTADIPLIERALADPDPLLRAAALGSIHRLGKLNSSRFLTALADKDAQVRRRAAELSCRLQLSDHERRQVLEGLSTCLDQEDEVAEVAAFALGEIGSQTASQDADQDATYQEIAEPGTVGLSPEIIAKLEHQARHHDNALCREQAVASLGALHSSPSTILDALNDKATVRRRAVIALAPFSGPETEAALRDALEDRDWQVRQAAEDLLAEESEDVEHQDWQVRQEGQ